MPISIFDSGAWATARSISVFDSGAWATVQRAWVFDSGAWALGYTYHNPVDEITVKALSDGGVIASIYFEPDGDVTSSPTAQTGSSRWANPILSDNWDQFQMRVDQVAGAGSPVFYIDGGIAGGADGLAVYYDMGSAHNVILCNNCTVRVRIRDKASPYTVRMDTQTLGNFVIT
jgi:hypothetical protein